MNEDEHTITYEEVMNRIKEDPKYLHTKQGVQDRYIAYRHRGRIE